MDQPTGGRRRIDRVTAPDLLDGLTDQSADVLRALRDDCREEEARLSYARRLVQGRLDIARSEMGRRESANSADAAETPEVAGRDTDTLVQQLARVLTDAPTQESRQARTVSFYSPDADAQPDRRSGDSKSGSGALSRLPDLAEADIARLVAELDAEEQTLSDARRAVLRNLDGLQAELVRRYREGSADLDAILSAALPGRRGEGTAD